MIVITDGLGALSLFGFKFMFYLMFYLKFMFSSKPYLKKQI